MKRLAASVLYLVMAAMGSPDASGAVLELDEDDVLACVDTHDGDDTSPLELLHRAGLACGESADAAWVACPSHHPRAAVTLSSDGYATATISLTSGPLPPAPKSISSSLLTRALTHSRDLGALKVLIESDHLPYGNVRTLVEARGFTFSRILDNGLMEFYTDLYWAEHTPGSSS